MIKRSNVQIETENSSSDAHNTRFRARQSWRNMIVRCIDPNHPAYKRYGGLGISIYSNWLEFDNFYKDMGGRPTGLTLERINNNIGYFPGNCIWATRKEQANNTRKQKLFLALGSKGQIEVSRHQTKFADKWNLNKSSISSCLHKRRNSHGEWKFEFLTPLGVEE